VIKESRYLEINLAYLQINAPLFVLVGLNDILWLFSIGGSFLSGSYFRQELTKLLISVDELPQHLLLYFQK